MAGAGDAVTQHSEGWALECVGLSVETRYNRLALDQTRVLGHQIRARAPEGGAGLAVHELRNSHGR